jgi:hypothetical protein
METLEISLDRLRGDLLRVQPRSNRKRAVEGMSTHDADRQY